MLTLQLKNGTENLVVKTVHAEVPPRVEYEKKLLPVLSQMEIEVKNIKNPRKNDTYFGQK